MALPITDPVNSYRVPFLPSMLLNIPLIYSDDSDPIAETRSTIHIPDQYDKRQYNPSYTFRCSPLQTAKGNPFFAHRGFLGLSRDLMDIDSHNAQQAKILYDYFRMIKEEEDIDIEEMYRYFVMGWNAELSEDHLFFKDFSRCTAQMFILIMDSLDALLSDTPVDDESLLLNDDMNIWYSLANARCWGDIRYREAF